MIKLLERIADEGILLDVVQGELKLFSENENIDPQVIREIQENKSKILSHLTQNNFAKGNLNSFSKIPQVPLSLHYPISDAQRRLWLLSQTEEGSVAYNMPSEIISNEKWDLICLSKAISSVIQRHEILRTIFKNDENDEIRQWVLPFESLDFKIDYKDFSEYPDADKRARNYIEEDSLKPFDLSQWPLLRTSVLKVTNDYSIFYNNLHHIVGDGWSMGILAKEVFKFYNAFKKNENIKLPNLGIQYKDYTSWQIQSLNEKSFHDHKAYWIKKLGSDNPRVALVEKKIRPKKRTYNGHSLETNISKDTVEQLKYFCQENGGSVFMTLLSTLNILLYRYSSQQEIIIGTPVAGRDHADLENQIGFYVNTLALKNKIDPQESFSSLFQRIKKSTLEDYAHQIYPFDRVVEDLELKRDFSRNPIFDVMLVLQNINEKVPGDKLEKEVFGSIIDLGPEPAKFDLTITFNEVREHIALHANFNTDIYDGEMIQGMMTHFNCLLKGLLINPLERVGYVDFLNPEEKNKQLKGFNNEFINYPKGKNIVGVFEEQVRQYPDKVALVFEETKLNYSELNEWSNRLASYLIENYNINSGDLIGVKLQKSEWVIISTLAILKAAGAYVPIDPNYPEERISFIKNDINSKVCLDEKELRIFREDYKSYSTKNLGLNIDSESLAYVIYTSGTTGNPKGVMLEHNNVIRLFFTDTPLFNFGDKDVWCMFHSYSFDFSVWEIYGALLFGGKLVLVSKNISKDSIGFANLLLEEKVTVLNQTPSAFNVLKEYVLRQPELYSIRYLIFGGEALNPSDLTGWRKVMSNCKIVNMYGITETTVHVTYKEIKDEDIKNNISNVGFPIPTLGCYLLGKNQELLPIGVPGEIYVSGSGVARGYLNRPELTSERFIPNKFSTDNTSKLYGSGDLGRWLPGGDIEYLGRIDEQVKIRGYRIELGEVEKVILQAPGITQCVVQVHEDSLGNKRLAAYVVANKKENNEELYLFLKTRLPEFMVPSFITMLSEFPLTSNGKINRKALPEPNLTNDKTEYYQAPRNETEQNLAEIWTEVLGLKKIGINRDFFQIGGDSIIAIRAISAINKFFGSKISIADLYQKSTISELSKLIDLDEKCNLENDKNRQEVIRSIDDLKTKVLNQFSNAEEVEDILPMSDIQKGMIYSSISSVGPVNYHDQLFFEIPSINFDRFKVALELMLKKHPILRTSFNLVDYSQEVQIVYKSCAVKANLVGLISYSADEQERFIKNYITDLANQPFDYNTAPIWSVTIFQIDQTKSVYLLQCHHAILDGWSVASFNTELFGIYQKLRTKPDFSPPKLTCSYKEVVVEELVEKNNIENINYWKQELDSYERLDIFSKDIQFESYSQSYSPEFHKKLLSQVTEENLTIKSLFFGAFVYSLNLISQIDDIVIGLVSNNRPLVDDGDKMLGCFLNTIPVRLNLEESKVFTLKNYFKKIDHQLKDLKGKDRLTLFEISKIVGENTGGENPFFDIIFNYIDFHIYNDFKADDELNPSVNEFEKEKLNLVSRNETNTLLDLSVGVKNETITVTYKLGKKLKSGLTLKDLHRYLDHILMDYLSDSSRNLSNDSFLTPEEIQEQLFTLNNTDTDYFNDTSLVYHFMEQAKKTPNNIAVVFEGKELTYKGIDEASWQLCDFLKQDYKIFKNDLVGVKLDRSEWLIITILGVLKLGAAYVPMDPEYPVEKLRFIEKDSSCKLCFDNRLLNRFKKKLKSLSTTGKPIDILSNDLAYIIYTSGSTGKPKGVMVEHQNVVNLIECQTKNFKIDPTDNFLLFSSVCFDASIEQLFLALLNGASLYVPSISEILNPDKFINLLIVNGITHLHAVPSFLRTLKYNSGLKLKRMVSGGDTFDARITKEWSSKATIFNEYGPTETTVTSFIREVKEKNLTGSPIGRPIANTNCYILNNRKELVPKGVVGEIYIGGDGVTRGYLNRPELTAQKFTKHPKIKDLRIFRTGDLGRWTKKGEIEFFGRKDNQVKIRGFRIELGEIEHAILLHPGIEEVCVNVRSNRTNENELVAYVVSSEKYNSLELRDFLKKYLTDYMVPTFFVKLDKIPVSPNGKINRKMLPAPLDSGLLSTESYHAPENAIQEKLVQIWEEVLEGKKIGIKDNFFDLGGHSLKAVKLISRLEKEFGISIEIKDLFKGPTIENLSQEIANFQLVMENTDIAGELEKFSI